MRAMRLRRWRWSVNAAILLANDSEREEARSMKPIDGHSAAYVCENFVCRLPVTEPAKLAELLQ